MAMFECKGNVFKPVSNPFSKSMSGNGTYYANPPKPVKNVKGSIRASHSTRCGNGDWVGGVVTYIDGLNKKTGQWETLGSVDAPSNGDQCPPGSESSSASFSSPKGVVYTNIRLTGYWGGTGSFICGHDHSGSISYWELQI